MKLAIATPIEGDPESARVCYAPQLAMRRLGGVVRMDERGPDIVGAYDVSKARNRMARVFLREPDFADCTHLLWWDEDVLPDDITVIGRLLASGHDVVGVPYRRKKDREEYPYRLAGVDGETRKVEVVGGCVEVDSLAFGFMLTSRAALERMWDAYKAERWYYDVYGGAGHESVGLFALQYTPVRPGPDGRPWRVELSEDYSFCQSWRAIGGRVMMYVGDGSPVGHIGATVFRGTREGLARGG